MSGTFTSRDREVARTTHKLFWKANFADGAGFIIWFLCRPLALFIYNILIPFAVAFCLQAIITRNFDKVNRYAIEVVLMALAYCVLWAIGGVYISRNGRIGTDYIQRRVFENYLEKDYEFFNNTMLGTLGTQANKIR